MSPGEWRTVPGQPSRAISSRSLTAWNRAWACAQTMPDQPKQAPLCNAEELLQWVSATTASVRLPVASGVSCSAAEKEASPELAFPQSTVAPGSAPVTTAPSFLAG